MTMFRKGIITSIYTENKILKLDAKEDTARGNRKLFRGLIPEEPLTDYSLPDLIGRKITIRKGKAVLIKNDCFNPRTTI